MTITFDIADLLIAAAILGAVFVLRYIDQLRQKLQAALNVNRATVARCKELEAENERLKNQPYPYSARVDRDEHVAYMVGAKRTLDRAAEYTAEMYRTEQQELQALIDRLTANNGRH